ncbi:MAG: restriction endonuclease subunit S, partial [Erysipelotrichia bacterium]|nr:restriction endonuclease subunit S [Erysipelotrichia bacterium]
KKIAAVLEKADELRRKREEQIKRLDDLLQATFLDMFGDPVTNPKGWMKCSLESLCFKVTDGTHQPPKFVAAGIPFLFVGNIVNGFIDFETEKFISEETFEKLTFRTPIEVGDILYSTVGSYGKAVLVDTTKKFSFQRHIAHIKPDFKKVQPEFLLTQLNSDGVKRQADSQVRGIAQKTLNLCELKGFEIFLPPYEKQIEFIKRKKRIDKTAMELKGSCSRNQALFSSLMQRAFKGELELK